MRASVSRARARGRDDGGVARARQWSSRCTELRFTLHFTTTTTTTTMALRRALNLQTFVRSASTYVYRRVSSRARTRARDRTGARDLDRGLPRASAPLRARVRECRLVRAHD